MNELLLELYSEEIPAKMQKKAEAGFNALFEAFLSKNAITYSKLEVFSGPCRITVHISDIMPFLCAQTIEVKGPRVGSPSSALEGFCRSNNTTIDKLIIENIKGQEFYFYRTQSSEIVINAFLEAELPNLIKQYVWPKTMLWGTNEINWVRPLRNILCICNEKIVPFIYGHLTANNISYGHKFLRPNSFTVTNFAEYRKLLKDNYVILSRKDREEQIVSQLDKLCAANNITIKPDPALLDEVIGLIEYPAVLLGKIPARFLDIPEEVLITSMRVHQKFFATLDENNKLAPYFACISNNPLGELDTILHGNEKVLNARLADALYFYSEDLVTSLDSMLEQEKRIIFHAELGSIYDKTMRIIDICKELGANEAIISAAKYCKADLVSQVVNEFPELQGLMGGYYAKHSGFSAMTSEAITKHYSPISQDDDVPNGEIAILALADKLDSLTGLYVAGERATGSKDPYGLRRLALGIIRIIIANKFSFSLEKLLVIALAGFKQTDTELLNELIQFITERFRYWLKQAGHNEKLLGKSDITNLSSSYDNIRKLETCLATSMGQKIAAAYKRAANMINFSATNSPLAIEQALIIDEHERSLYQLLLTLAQSDIQNLDESLAQLEILSNAVDKFLDNNLVKHEDAAIAANRYALLQQVCSTYHKTFDFSVL